jgi:hypothetical protein
MLAKIEDYALIGDCQTAALVSRDGSIDWLCFPRFDSPACFAALLGTEEHGRWHIMPAGRIRKLRRRYRDGTLILETDFVTDEGYPFQIGDGGLGSERFQQMKASVLPRKFRHPAVRIVPIPEDER